MPLYYIINVFNQPLKYYESIKSCVFLMSPKYVVGVVNLFPCLLLIELNTWEDD